VEYVVCLFLAYCWVSTISAAYVYAKQRTDVPEKLVVCLIAGFSWPIIGLLSVLHLWQDNCKRHVWVPCDSGGEYCLLCGVSRGGCDDKS
jgi:hypothetical protein